MEPISDIEAVTVVAGSVCAGLDAVRGAAFWKIGDDDLLTFAETLERVGRLVYAAQVHLTGELDTRRVFQHNGAVSTAALLRQRLCISPGDAAGRVRAFPGCDRPVLRDVAGATVYFLFAGFAGFSRAPP